MCTSTCCPNVQDADWQDRVRAIFSAVSDAVIRLGGTPSGEHGAGRLRAGLLRATLRPRGDGVLPRHQARVRSRRVLQSRRDPRRRQRPAVETQGRDGARRAPAGVDAYLAAIENEARWGEKPVGRVTLLSSHAPLSRAARHPDRPAAIRRAAASRRCSGASRAATASGWPSSPAGSAT